MPGEPVTDAVGGGVPVPPPVPADAVTVTVGWVVLLPLHAVSSAGTAAMTAASRHLRRTDRLRFIFSRAAADM